MTPRQQGGLLFDLMGTEPKFRNVPVAMFDVIIALLATAGRVFPAAARKAELARIGRYYATESMLCWDPIAGKYDADATPETARAVQRHRQRIEDLISAMTVEEKAGQLNLLADPFRWMPTAVNPLDGTGDPLFCRTWTLLGLPCINVPGLVGDWLENGCVVSGAQSFKRLTRATDLSANSIRYLSGVFTYGNTTCSGVGSLAGPSNLGTVVFSRAESNASVAASWGEFTTVTNTRSQVIWAKKSETVLCLLGDQSPSILPTLNDVAASLVTLPDSACFTQQ